MEFRIIALVVGCVFLPKPSENVGVLQEYSTATVEEVKGVSSSSAVLTTLDPVGKIRHLLPEVNAGNGSLNITVQVGTTAYLPCRFIPQENQEISDDQVSWFRRRDWHILTAGIHTYTNDARFTVLHKPESFDWTLQIKYTTSRDNGTYECQLSTGTGVLSQFVNLHIVTPKAVILGNRDYHVQLSSQIQLTCNIEQILSPPQYIYWYHNDQMINYDHNRGGISVSFELRPIPRSHLTISDTSHTDSGNYTCTALGTEPASVNVFVSNGDNIAAIQRRKSSASTKTVDSLIISIPFILLSQLVVTEISIVAILRTCFFNAQYR